MAFLSQWTPSGTVSGYFIITPIQKVATPAFIVAPATFVTSTQVGITCATPGAVIRFTTDGTAPTPNSPLYTTPFTITKSTPVAAKAFKSGMTDSDILTGYYVITAVAPTQGVDLMIKTSSIGNTIGEGIIDLVGDQVATKTTLERRTAYYIIVLINTGNTMGYFSVTAIGSKAGWYVNFADPTGKNITQMVTSNYGWLVPAVPPGKTVTFRLDVTPVSGTVVNDSLDVIITATSKVDTTIADQVKAATTKIK
jgi:hypothetical protein